MTRAATAWWACLAVAAAAAPPEGPFDGDVSLTLGRAVPFAGRNEPSLLPAPRSTFRDLRLDLTCRDGRWDATVWAFTECIPAVEHRGTLTSANSDANAESLRLEIDLPISHHLPLVVGGRCRYTVELRRVGRKLLGHFTGSSRVPTAKAELEALAGEWAPPGTKKPKLQPDGQLLAQKFLEGEAIGYISAPRGKPAREVPSTAPARRPRLLFGAEDLPALRKRAAAGPGRKALELLRRSLAAMDAGDLNVTPYDSEGYAAAAWALLHVLCAEPDAAQRAARWARRAMSRRPALPPVGAARRLAGLAIAYDLCRDAWPAEPRNAVAAQLAAQARQLATFRRVPAVPDELSVQPWPVQGPYDYRLAMFRAAAGLAALAVADDLPQPQTAPASRESQGSASLGIADVRVVCERSVRRFLQTAVGDRGCEAGSYGYEKVLETVLPFVQACRRGGSDPAAGTGAAYIALWGMMTDGRTFGPVEMTPLSWLPLSAGVLERRCRPLAAEYLSRACGGENVALPTPLHGVMLLLNAGAAGAADCDAAPLRLEDRQMGGYVFRSGWGAGDFVTVVQRAAGPFPTAHLAGNFTVSGLAREWITRPFPPAGDFRWPARHLLNAVQVRPAARRETLLTAYPVTGARLLTARPLGLSGGCLSMENDVFSHVDTRTVAAGGLGPDAAPIAAGHIRRTIAADYSRASGAEAVIVIIDEVHGFFPRQPVWQVYLGPLPPESVQVRGDSFRVAPPGTKATLVGTVLHPPSAVLQYVAPAAGPQGLHGRVEAWFHPRGQTNAELFEQSTEKAFKAVRDWLAQDELERRHRDRMDAKPGKYTDTRVDGKGLSDVLAERLLKEVAGKDLDKERQERRRRQRQALRVFARLLMSTTAEVPGGADRVARAGSTFVTVLTIQSGPPPEITFPDVDSPVLLRVGPQDVCYREDLIEFGRLR